METIEQWHPSNGDGYFGITALYDIDWTGNMPRGMRLEYMKAFGCEAGGAMAMFRDESKIVLALSTPARPDIYIIAPDGAMMNGGRIPWTGGRIVTAGWNDNEELLLVDDRGSVACFTVAGVLSSQFSFGGAVESEGVVDAIVTGRSVAVVTAALGQSSLWCIPDTSHPRPHRWGVDSNLGFIACMAMVRCEGSLTMVVACEDGEIFLLDSEGTKTQLALDYANTVSASMGSLQTITKLVVSPDSRYIAGYASNDTIYVWQSDPECVDVIPYVRFSVLDAILSSHTEKHPGPLGPGGPPDTWEWCGSDAVVACWAGHQGRLLVCTVPSPAECPPNELFHLQRFVDLSHTIDWIEHEFGDREAHSTPILTPEIDGLRIFTERQCAFFRKIPGSLTTTLELGSTSPAALLYDARKLLEDRDPRSATQILDILRTGDLQTAVLDCLLAAESAAFDPETQEHLMKAACYGRNFLGLKITKEGKYDENGNLERERFYNMVDTVCLLRVLNALRPSPSALALTVPQFQRLREERLLKRLAARRQYGIALRVAEVLDDIGKRRRNGVGVVKSSLTHSVLLSWAIDRVKDPSASEHSVLVCLDEKLGGGGSMKTFVHGWAQLAEAASAAGRRELALKLLERERCVADQVPLLMALGEAEKALQRAVNSGDYDLVFYVTHALWRRAMNVTGHQSAGQVSSYGGSSSSSGSGRGGDAVAAFWSLISSYPDAAAVFATYLKGSGTVEGVHVLWEASEDWAKVAVSHATLAAGHTEDLVNEKKEWNMAKDAYTKAEKIGREDAKFEGAAAAAAIRLLELQSELERSSGREGFLGLSVVDTLRQCVRVGMREQAQKIAKEFKVSEKQQMLIVMHVTAGLGDWRALRDMADRLDRRAPVKFDHFVDVARQHNAPLDVIRSFIDRMGVGEGEEGVRKKANAYAEVGLHEQAAALMQASLQQGSGGGGGAALFGNLREVVEGTMSSLMTKVPLGQRGGASPR
jgi:hypothetical protein